MPRLPRWSADDAIRALLDAGFEHVRSNGSHRIYRKGSRRVVVPYHAGKVLHPKIVKQILMAIESRRNG